MNAPLKLPRLSEGATVSEIVPRQGELASFTEARQFKVKQAKANAIIEFAARVKDWPLLTDAVDAKIEDQAEFVRWWDEKVGVAAWGAERGQ